MPFDHNEILELIEAEINRVEIQIDMFIAEGLSIVERDEKGGFSRKLLRRDVRIHAEVEDADSWGEKNMERWADRRYRRFA